MKERQKHIFIVLIIFFLTVMTLTFMPQIRLDVYLNKMFDQIKAFFTGEKLEEGLAPYYRPWYYNYYRFPHYNYGRNYGPYYRSKFYYWPYYGKPYYRNYWNSYGYY